MVPHGRPDTMFLAPEFFDTSDRKVKIMLTWETIERKMRIF